MAPPGCTICFSDFGSDETLQTIGSCGHIFHTQCLQQWLETAVHKRCPLCRVPCSKVHNVFLTSVGDSPPGSPARGGGDGPPMDDLNAQAREYERKRLQSQLTAKDELLEAQQRLCQQKDLEIKELQAKVATAEATIKLYDTNNALLNLQYTNAKAAYGEAEKRLMEELTEASDDNKNLRAKVKSLENMIAEHRIKTDVNINEEELARLVEKSSRNGNLEHVNVALQRTLMERNQQYTDLVLKFTKLGQNEKMVVRERDKVVHRLLDVKRQLEEFKKENAALKGQPRPPPPHHRSEPATPVQVATAARRSQEQAEPVPAAERPGAGQADISNGVSEADKKHWAGQAGASSSEAAKVSSVQPGGLDWREDANDLLSGFTIVDASRKKRLEQQVKPGGGPTFNARLGNTSPLQTSREGVGSGQQSSVVPKGAQNAENGNASDEGVSRQEAAGMGLRGDSVGQNSSSSTGQNGTHPAGHQCRSAVPVQPNGKAVETTHMRPAEQSVNPGLQKRKATPYTFRPLYGEEEESMEGILQDNDEIPYEAQVEDLADDFMAEIEVEMEQMEEDMEEGLGRAGEAGVGGSSGNEEYVIDESRQGAERLRHASPPGQTAGLPAQPQVNDGSPETDSDGCQVLDQNELSSWHRSKSPEQSGQSPRATSANDGPHSPGPAPKSTTAVRIRKESGLFGSERFRDRPAAGGNPWPSGSAPLPGGLMASSSVPLFGSATQTRDHSRDTPPSRQHAQPIKSLNSTIAASLDKSANRPALRLLPQNSNGASTSGTESYQPSLPRAQLRAQVSNEGEIGHGLNPGLQNPGSTGASHGLIGVRCGKDSAGSFITSGPDGRGGSKKVLKSVHVGAASGWTAARPAKKANRGASRREVGVGTINSYFSKTPSTR